MAERKRILLVEDDEINTLLVIEALVELPYEVDAAVSGDEGVRLFEQRHYDLVIMDVQLPGLDGFQATARIREQEQRTDGRHTPILAATANAYPTDRARCLAAGMDDYLSKPFDLDVFIERVAQLTDRPASR